MKAEAQPTWIELLRRLAPLLSADLFSRLRAVSSPADLQADEARSLAAALQEAIGELDTLHHTLTTFLPRYLLDLAPTPGEPHGELLEGTFIFADVTGFTALTGELSKRGSEGREEMNRLMSALFGALLDPLLTSGGDLLIFAGDAALAYFPADPQGRDVRWATRTALRLVEGIADFAQLETPYGTFSLTMSAGVERGRAYAAVVGTPQRMELLVSGGATQAANAAEAEADPSQVFCGPVARAMLSPDEFAMQGGVVHGLLHGELDDYEAIPPARRRGRFSAIFSRRVPDLIEHLAQVLTPVENLVPFLPDDVLAQIIRHEDVRQHPPVAVQFVNVMGLEELALGGSPELATAALQRYFVQAHEIVTDREGMISQVDTYARGFTLLNPFGAPTHHEGVPRLAASAALELARTLRRVNDEFALDPPLTQRTGLTYDRIFTGEIGYRHRREYVVAGPAVNLAARLMGKAEPGQIVLDPLAWEAVKSDFCAVDLPPIPLKGIAQPVPRFALQGLARGRGLHLTDYPLAGREEELARLEIRLQQACAGRGGALALLGEAGIGKTRLTGALAQSAQRQGMVVLHGRCQPFSQSTPYAPWTNLVADWCALDQEQPVAERRRTLQEWLADFDLAPALPLLADLLGLPPAVDLAARATQARPSAAPAPAAPQRAGGLFAALQQTDESPASAPKASGGWARLAARVEQAQGARPAAAGPSIWQVLRERADVAQVLQTLFERQARRQPTLLIVEDVQWIDDESRRILAALAAAASDWPLLLLVTTRPETDWWPGQVQAMSPLTDAGSRELAAYALRAHQLEPALADWLLARAGGSPLFILSYCRALRDSGAVVVDPTNEQAVWNGPPPDLPLSLQEILLAQVDRLTREAREVLRHGAVIGVTFPDWLLAALTDGLPAEQLEQALDVAARRALVGPPPPIHDHCFSSHSLHDAVYQTLSYSQRRRWHERVGDRLAEGDETTRYERLEQIAYHYGRSDNPLKAAHFNRRCGDKSRARQAYSAALAFYEQTLAVRDGAEVAAEQQLAREGSGDVHALRQDAAAAQAAYRSALVGAAAAVASRLQAKLALLGPLVDGDAPSELESAREALAPTEPLRAWLDAAQVWQCATRGDVAAAQALCQAALSGTCGMTESLLQEAGQKLARGEPLPPYAEFFALFARSVLKLAPGEVPC